MGLSRHYSRLILISTIFHFLKPDEVSTAPPGSAGLRVRFGRFAAAAHPSDPLRGKRREKPPSRPSSLRRTGLSPAQKQERAGKTEPKHSYRAVTTSPHQKCREYYSDIMNKYAQTPAFMV
jgi:hypothetical protein